MRSCRCQPVSSACPPSRRMCGCSEDRPPGSARARTPAKILGRPEIQLIRYQRTLSDEEAAALAPRAGGRQTGTRSADDPPDPPVLGSAGTGPAADQPPLDQPPLAQPDQLDPPVGGPAERAEAPAGPAEAAAERLEAAADSAEEAAGRAEAVTARVVSAHSASR